MVTRPRSYLVIASICFAVGIILLTVALAHAAPEGPPPLVVMVEDFTASQQGNVVVLTWTPGAGVANLITGYNIYAGPTPAAWTMQVNSTLLHPYTTSFEDYKAAGTVYYWLEALTTWGPDVTGPVSATMPIPTAVRLSRFRAR